MDKSHHKEAIVTSEDFCKVMSHQQPDMRSRLSQAMSDQIASNRQKLTSIFKRIVLCRHQNIALHGRHDNITDIESHLSDTKHHGNFWALLNFRVDSGYTVLGEHLAKAGKNATYTSYTIQNHMIDVLADHVRGKIIWRFM